MDLHVQKHGRKKWVSPLKDTDMRFLEEHCGLFGIYSTQNNCISDLVLGMFKLQHRGQHSCGLSVWNKGIKNHVFPGLVRQAFSPDRTNAIQSSFGIGHVSIKEMQPIRLESKLGEFAIAFSGNILNAEELFSQMKKENHSFTNHTHVELLGKLISQEKTFPEGLANISAKAHGSWTILLLTQEGIYAARDPRGYKPLILGAKDTTVVVSSESRPFSLLGCTIVRDVLPGEIVFLGPEGISTVLQAPAQTIQHCAFEWGYIASMDSIIDGIPVVRARNNLGAALAKNDNVEADIVAPIPFSGIGYALGYHREAKIPYDEVFLIDRFASRSYMPLTQEERDQEAKIKLSVVSDSVKGKRIILCDDSIVRGTQIRNKVLELKAYGAREVHVRVGCPPLVAPCLYDISTRSYQELAATRYSIKEICRRIGADTLRYNSIEDMVKAIGIPETNLCLHCWRKKDS